MNSKFLGDAFDHWKGSLIQRLLSEGLLENFSVEPMITDVKPWDENTMSTYIRLLNLTNDHQIINRRRIFSNKRKKYFQNIRHRGDIFLDPDTGIATGKASQKHIQITELKKLLEDNRKRILLVYQHAARGPFKKRIESIIKRVFQDIPNLYCITYECGAVAMLYFSFHKDRIVAIKKYFDHLLADACTHRVRLWSNFA